MTQFWDKLKIVIAFVPPFLNLNQCIYFMRGNAACQEQFVELGARLPAQPAAPCWPDRASSAPSLSQCQSLRVADVRWKGKGT